MSRHVYNIVDDFVASGLLEKDIFYIMLKKILYVREW